MKHANYVILETPKVTKSVLDPIVIGGIGEKKSNGGTQWYQQDRIYDDKIALSISTCCLPYYIIRKYE